MVSLRSPLLLAVASAALASSAAGFKLTVQNNCAHSVDLYTRLASVFTDDHESIASGGSCTRNIPKGYEGHFRHGKDDAATLIEFATKGDYALAWFDVSVIPPRLNKGHEFCGSLEDCKKNSQSGKGFNVAVQVTPLSNTNGANCRELTCLADGCEDAYLYPKDDTKTHSCPLETDFKVTFCPNGSPAQTQAPVQTPKATTKAPETKAPETKAPVTQSPAQTPAPKDDGAGKVNPGNYDVDDDKPKTESGVITKQPVLTQAPVTQAPVTQAPATKAPITQTPAATKAPITQTPAATKAPITQSPAAATKAPIAQTPAVTPSVTPAASKTRTPKPKHCV